VNTIPTLAPICPLRSASPRSQTVLVVDDFAPVCDLVAWHLFAIGYHVLTAHDPVEAQRMILSATDSEIDLLLTDFELPKMRGDTLAEWCVKVRPQTRVLLMSSSLECQRGVGEVGFIEKPFSLEKLSGAVREALAVRTSGEPELSPAPLRR
jgi:DNA-binding NtrC family response regulator